ncbi:hypothetical protein BDN72DRAFT_956703 [Pluteus cervinus]|uniref:Uncharacterized protein n=1 Tax=Pluteus cervinus TaxID=181527 RepID=A0ACD3B5G3_9AGAR|nr:hypothetical protein BDN72DRAFT_956703 [Pluteus cervinus]
MSYYTAPWGIDSTNEFVPFETGQGMPPFFAQGWDKDPEAQGAEIQDYVDRLYYGAGFLHAPLHPLGMADDSFLPVGSIASAPGMDDPLLWSNSPLQASVWAPSPEDFTYTPTGIESSVLPPPDFEFGGMECPATLLPGYGGDEVYMAPPPQDASSDSEEASVGGSPSCSSTSPEKHRATKSGRHTAMPKQLTRTSEAAAARRSRGPSPKTEQERLAEELVKTVEPLVGQTKKWKCPECDMVTARKPDLVRHVQSHLHAQRERCVGCNCPFSRIDGLNRHYERFPECKRVRLSFE